jgi:hypothetical protein
LGKAQDIYVKKEVGAALFYILVVIPAKVGIQYLLESSFLLSTFRKHDIFLLKNSFTLEPSFSVSCSKCSAGVFG